jgi:hypothetical protein
MESKYYTPDISEFHVGFECEQYDNNSKEWKKYTVDKYTWSSNGIWKLFYDNPEESFRVKYLDKEDIESLDFILDEEGPQCYITFKKDNLWLQYGSFSRDESQQLSIQNLELGEFVFFGTVKNKSELKTLLKWLNIV